MKLIEKKIYKKLQTYIYKEKEYYIFSGVFILPFAKSLVVNQGNLFNGYLIDTTWRIMPFYTTSILIACMSNTSLPIVFVFGQGENKKITNI